MLVKPLIALPVRSDLQGAAVSTSIPHEATPASHYFLTWYKARLLNALKDFVKSKQQQKKGKSQILNTDVTKEIHI